MGVAALASGCGGGGAEVGCSEPEPCGGNPVGLWKVQSACQSVPALAYTTSMLYPPQTMPQTPKLAKPPPSNKAERKLVLGARLPTRDPEKTDFPKGRVTSVNLYYPPAPLNFGSITIAPNHTVLDRHRGGESLHHALRNVVPQRARGQPHLHRFGRANLRVLPSDAQLPRHRLLRAGLAEGAVPSRFEQRMRLLLFLSNGERRHGLVANDGRCPLLFQRIQRDTAHDPRRRFARRATISPSPDVRGRACSTSWG